MTFFVIIIFQIVYSLLMPASLPAQDHQTLEFQVGLEHVYTLIFVLCVSSVRVLGGLADHRAFKSK